MHDIQLVPQDSVKRGYTARAVQSPGNLYRLQVIDSNSHKEIGFLSMAYEPRVRLFKTMDSLVKKATELKFGNVVIDL